MYKITEYVESLKKTKEAMNAVRDEMNCGGLRYGTQIDCLLQGFRNLTDAGEDYLNSDLSEAGLDHAMMRLFMQIECGDFEEENDVEEDEDGDGDGDVKLEDKEDDEEERKHDFRVIFD